MLKMGEKTLSLKPQLPYICQCLIVRLLLSEEKGGSKHKALYALWGIFQYFACAARSVPIQFKVHVLFY